MREDREKVLCVYGAGRAGRDQCEGLDETGRVLGNRNAELDWAQIKKKKKNGNCRF